MNAKPVEHEPRTRPAPSAPALQAYNGTRVEIEYAGAPDGVDSNLLILLHGLGDRAAPFRQLGTSLQRTLPQTAVLCIQGLKRVPLLEEDAWMWWDTFDMLGETIPNPDPRHAIGAIEGALAYLCAPQDKGGCAWPIENVHLFGYGQGGSLALEALAARRPNAIGSVTSVCGPFLSLPTFTPPLTTPACFVTRFAPPVLQSSALAKGQLAAVKKAFAHVTHHNYPPSQAPVEEAMIRGSEWRDLHVFWSKLWRNRSAWELGGDLYTVS